MVFLIGHALWTIGRIAIKLRRLAFEVYDQITWSIAGAEAPDVLGITIPTHGVGNGIVALRIGGAAGILEIIKPGGARGRIIDAAIVNPHGPILMREVRRKGEVAVRTFSAPVFGEGRSPCLEGALLSRVRPRAEREQIERHALVIAIPISLNKAALRVPAHRDCFSAHAIGLHPIPFG